MRIFVAVLVLIFSFQSFTKADDIKDFEIEGLSIGASLLDFYDLNEISLSEDNPTYYPKSNKFKVIFFETKTNELFDYLNITVKDNDKKYIIYGVRGEKEISLDSCFKMKNEQVKAIGNMLSKAKKRDYEGGYGDSYGNSKADITEFTFEDGSMIRIFCADYDDENEVVKNNLWKDSLEVSINSKEFSYFLTYEAY